MSLTLEEIECELEFTGSTPPCQCMLAAMGILCGRPSVIRVMLGCARDVTLPYFLCLQCHEDIRTGHGICLRCSTRCVIVGEC